MRNIPHVPNGHGIVANSPAVLLSGVKTLSICARSRRAMLNPSLKALCLKRPRERPEVSSIEESVHLWSSSPIGASTGRGKGNSASHQGTFRSACRVGAWMVTSPPATATVAIESASQVTSAGAGCAACVADL